MLPLLDLTSHTVSPLTLIFLLDQDRVLTLRRSMSKQIFPGKLTGFGGKVEPGEDLFASARREFLEETGLTLRDPTLRGTFTRILDNGYINQLLIFVATSYEGALRQHSDEGTVAWMPITAFLEHADLVPHIPLYLPKILAGSDFYCGIAQSTDLAQDATNYTDNTRHFAERR